MTQKILLTGGGSAGHITVNMALIPMLLETGWEIIYIGSFDGIERELISNTHLIKYFAISTGKLRRYFDIQNFIDIVRIIKGSYFKLIVRFARKNQIWYFQKVVLYCCTCCSDW